MIWKNLKKNCQSKQKFYSVLTGKKIKDKEHEHALNVWNKFENKTMKDYHNLYLKCDILLLADVFGKFRNNSLKKLCIMSKFARNWFERNRFKLGWNA